MGNAGKKKTSEDKATTTKRINVKYENNAAVVIHPKHFSKEAGLNANEKPIELTYHTILDSFEDATNLRELLKISIENFVDVRNFLALQLDHALGNVGNDQFEEEKKPYLTRFDSISHKDLKTALKTLLEYLDQSFSADELCAIFNCSEDKLQLAFDELEKEIEK